MDHKPHTAQTWRAGCFGGAIFMDASCGSYSIVDNLTYVLHDLSVWIIISCFVHQCEIIMRERHPCYASWCSYQADNMVWDNITSIGTHLVHHPNFKFRSKTNCSPIYHVFPITLTMTKLELLSKLAREPPTQSLHHHMSCGYISNLELCS